MFRLINVNTHALKEFEDANIPPYAVFSHVHKPGGAGEVSYADWQDLIVRARARQLAAKFHLASDDPLAADRCQRIRSLPGYTKIIRFFDRLRDYIPPYPLPRIEWAWVYTVCVDRSSSAEVEESVVAHWSRLDRAAVCLVLLDDVAPPPVQLFDVDALPAVANSRWFTRAWTLPELLAPRVVRFYDARWGFIGTRAELATAITVTTQVEQGVLTGKVHPCAVSAAHRIAWAARRDSARPEDLAYALQGLLGVSLSPRYGEGFAAAFRRLQEKALRVHGDSSLLAWGFHGCAGDGPHGPLAAHPRQFITCRHIVRPGHHGIEFRPSSRGLWMTTAVFRPPSGRVIALAPPTPDYVYALLDCTYYRGQLLVPLVPARTTREYYRAPGCTALAVRVSFLKLDKVELREILIRNDAPPRPAVRLGLQIRGLNTFDYGMVLQEIWPPTVASDGGIYLPHDTRKRSRWVLLRVWTYIESAVIMIRYPHSGGTKESGSAATALSSTAQPPPPPPPVLPPVVKIFSLKQMRAPGDERDPRCIDECFWSPMPRETREERLEKMFAQEPEWEYAQTVLANLQPTTVTRTPPGGTVKQEEREWALELRYNRTKLNMKDEFLIYRLG